VREKKYIEFLKDIEFPKEREKYIKNVKYRIVDELDDKYIVSKRSRIAFSKSKEGELFIIGKI
jgi:rRNA processing protein Krr1/Pno1